MGSILVYKGMPPLTAEELAELEALKNMKDEDIDFSDIPEITDEEWKKFKRVNPLPVERQAVGK